MASSQSSISGVASISSTFSPLSIRSLNSERPCSLRIFLIMLLELTPPSISACCRCLLFLSKRSNWECWPLVMAVSFLFIWLSSTLFFIVFIFLSQSWSPAALALSSASVAIQSDRRCSQSFWIAHNSLRWRVTAFLSCETVMSIAS
eukprot:scaffold10733_cov47-Cyclotella_meneghiniana.AAC.4